MTVNKRYNYDDLTDFFPTPKWATKALFKFEHFKGPVWEPACGDGNMVEAIKESTGLPVYASDLIDRGYQFHNGMDFLHPTMVPAHRSIITNPPYSCAEEFILKAVELETPKFAFLLRLAFLESQRRYDKIFSKTPPTTIYSFSQRVQFSKKAVESQTKQHGTIAFAWFVWDRTNTTGNTTLKWIPPGLRKDD